MGLDSDYVIIKKYIGKDFQEVLFKHTRELRERRRDVSHGGGPTEQTRKSPEEHSGLIPALCLDLEDRYFKGPIKGKGAYASICILDPIITIERHGGKYHIAARFNVETTILRYSTQKSNDHEWFFHDICLQYMQNLGKEDLVMKPESDPAAAFTVTRSSNTTISGQAGATFSEIPSANVSLGLSRSTGLTVEYAVNTWSLSAHRIVNRSPPDIDLVLRSKGKRECLKTKIGKSPSDNPRLPYEQKHAQYQWFWTGNQEETKRLTPDLKHTVKRHVVVKRIIPPEQFPVSRVENARAVEQAEEEERRLQDANGSDEEPQAENLRAASAALAEARRVMELDWRNLMVLERLLNFSFCIRIRVKRRYGRLHRLFLLSSNRVKAKFLNPTYEEEFRIQAKGINEAKIPLEDTVNIAAALDEIKEKNDGKWDELQGKKLVDIQDYEGLLTFGERISYNMRTEHARERRQSLRQRAPQTHVDDRATRRSSRMDRDSEIGGRTDFLRSFDREYRPRINYRVQRGGL